MTAKTGPKIYGRGMVEGEGESSTTSTTEARQETRRQSRAESQDDKSPPRQEKQGEREKQGEQEKQEQISESAENDFPEGGSQAWLVAAGTAGILFCSLGYSNSFGVFQSYYMRHQLQEHTPDDISWIGSIQAFLVFSSGAIGGPIFDRYGAWVIQVAIFRVPGSGH